MNKFTGNPFGRCAQVDIFIGCSCKKNNVKVIVLIQKKGGVYIPITVLFSFPFPSLLEADTDTEMLLFVSRERKQACGSDEFKLEVVKVVQEGLARLSLNSTVKLRTSPLMPFDILNRSCNACTMVKLLNCHSCCQRIHITCL